MENGKSKEINAFQSVINFGCINCTVHSDIYLSYICIPDDVSSQTCLLKYQTTGTAGKYLFILHNYHQTHG